MTQYIDKSAVVAEIERRKHKLLDSIIRARDKEWVVRTTHQLNRIISFLNTIEVKTVDLEKEIQDYIYTLPYSKTGIPNGWKHSWERKDVEKIAKHFFELGIKTQKGE